MSISIVVGPPGAGKTLWTCRQIRQGILDGRYVVTNVVLVEDWAERIADSVLIYRWGARRRKFIQNARSRVVVVDSIDDVVPMRLATDGWEKNLEGRGYLVWDEAGEDFDSRSWNEDKERRKRHNRFMRQHRKLGWEVFLVAQEEEQIDTRVRGMSTYVVHLVNLKNLKLAWWLPRLPFMPNLFRAHWNWHGQAKREPHKIEVYGLHKPTANLYDTHQIVSKGDEHGADAVWLPLGYEPTPREEYARLDLLARNEAEIQAELMAEQADEIAADVFTSDLRASVPAVPAHVPETKEPRALAGGGVPNLPDALDPRREDSASG